MNKIGAILLILSFFCNNLVSAQAFKGKSKTVKIKGTAKEYSGTILSFYYEKDFITHTQQKLISFEPDYDGKFEVNFPLEETRKLVIELGSVNGVLYAEPGKTYQLVFPPRIEKTKKQSYNPYFVPQEIFLGVINQNRKDLNTLIANLEDSLASRLEPGLGILRQTANRKSLEKILTKMDTFFSDIDNPYFISYKNYRYHYLRYFVYLRDNERMLENYFANAPILLNVPTYTFLFEKLAKHGLTLKASKKKWSAYYTVEKELGLKTLRDSLQRFSYLQKRSFMDLYITNGLHNIFYNKYFTQNKVMSLLTELKDDASPEVKKLAQSVHSKLSHLRVGSLAPDLSLINEKGEKVRLLEYSGKFIYLNFGTAWSVPFKKELELLKKLNDKRIKDLVILTVSMDNDFNKMLTLKEENNYDWTFFHFDFNSKVAETYKLKVYPTYYLIGPDGSFIMSPAPTISEDFLERFLNIYQKWQRDQYKIRQGIKN